MNNGPSHVVQTQRLFRSCYLRNLSPFAALPRSRQLSRSALRPAPPTADSAPRPPRAAAHRRPPLPCAGCPEARRAALLHPPGKARLTAWPWSPPSSGGLARFPKLTPPNPPFPFRIHWGRKTESTDGVVRPAW